MLFDLCPWATATPPTGPREQGFGACCTGSPRCRGSCACTPLTSTAKQQWYGVHCWVILSCCWTQTMVSQDLSNPLCRSVRLWNTKEFIALVFQFNTGLPLKTLVICWGPYCLLCFYAAVENVMFISPKYRMVRLCHLREFKQWHSPYSLLSVPMEQCQFTHNWFYLLYMLYML